MPKIKNIIIFVAIAGIFVLIYIFYIKPAPAQTSLVSSTTSLPNINGSPTDTQTPAGATVVAKDFLALLLSVKNIKLNDAIFSDPAFNTLRDSSIVLVQDGTEGRPNPFAKFGSDNVPLPLAPVVSPITPPTTPPVIPPPATP